MLLWDLWIWKYCFFSRKTVLCCYAAFPQPLTVNCSKVGFWFCFFLKSTVKKEMINLHHLTWSTAITLVIMGSDNHLISNHSNKATLTSANSHTDTLKPVPTLWEHQGCTLGCLFLFTWAEQLNNQASSAFFHSNNNPMSQVPKQVIPSSPIFLDFQKHTLLSHNFESTLSLIFTNGTGKSHFTLSNRHNSFCLFCSPLP